MDGAEAVDRLLGEALHLGLLADVERTRQHVDAEGLQLRGGRGQGVVLDVGEDEVEPGPGEPLGQRQARSRSRRR